MREYQSWLLPRLVTRQVMSQRSIVGDKIVPSKSPLRYILHRKDKTEVTQKKRPEKEDRGYQRRAETYLHKFRLCGDLLGI